MSDETECWDEPVTTPAAEWDQATPVPIPRPADTAGTLDPEEYIIGCCILDEGITLQACRNASLSATDFANPELSAIYTGLCDLQSSATPIALDTLYPAVKAKTTIQRLMSIADPIAIGTTSRVSHYIQRILTLSATRREVNRAKATLERIAKGEEVAAPATAPISSRLPQRKPSEFLIPPDDDKSVLLGNRFLNRGDGGILVGSSGMGKSSAAIQMSVSWALGLPFQGIKSNGAMRILIIQSEDSDGDIAEVMLSMRHMLKLTPEQIEQVDTNIRIVCDRVNRGRAFIASLKAHIAEHKPDIVIINPLQAFIDGDVTDSRDLGQFLREGLNGLNDSTFGYILIHHTTKPATGRDKGAREWHEVMYDMAGGAELINWARFIISLRATPTEGNFNFVLAKRGRRAGVTKLIEHGVGTREEPVTTIPVRHAKGSIPVAGRSKPVSIIFWEGREEDAPVESGSNSGRKEKFQWQTYRNLFPPHNSNGKPFAQIHRDLMANGEIPKGSLQAVLKRWADDTHIEMIDGVGQPTLYRCRI